MKDVIGNAVWTFLKKVDAHGDKPRLLSEFETSDGRKYGFFFGGKEVCIYASNCDQPYAISGSEFSAPMRLAPILEHLRTTFKIDPLDDAFGWMIVCSQAVQKMMKREKRGKRA